MQRAGSIPLYLNVIPCAKQFTGVHLRTSEKRAPKPFNSCEPLRTFPITSGNRFRRFPNTSKDFRRFPKILKSHKNIWKLLLNRFRSFSKFSENFRRFPNTSADFRRFLACPQTIILLCRGKSSEKHVCRIEKLIHPSRHAERIYTGFLTCINQNNFNKYRRQSVSL